MARPALLQLHPVENMLHNQRVAVFRHKLTCRASRKRLRGTVEVTLVTGWDTAVFKRKGWEGRLDETVLRNQSLGTTQTISAQTPPIA